MLEMYFPRRAPDREKGPHVVIEASSATESTVAFRYRILGIGLWERRGCARS